MFWAVVTMACSPDEQRRFTAIGDQLHGQAGLDRGDTRHIGRTAFGGDGVAHGHIIDELRIGSGPADRFFHHDARQFGWLNIGKGSAEGSNRRTGRAQNDHITLTHASAP